MPSLVVLSVPMAFSWTFPSKYSSCWSRCIRLVTPTYDFFTTKNNIYRIRVSQQICVLILKTKPLILISIVSIIKSPTFCDFHVTHIVGLGENAGFASGHEEEGLRPLHCWHQPCNTHSAGLLNLCPGAGLSPVSYVSQWYKLFVAYVVLKTLYACTVFLSMVQPLFWK